MWEEVAVAEGMTYEQLIAESEGEGETETGETVSFTHKQELAGMRGQGCWAFVDTRNNTIHAWADEATPRELVLHMLAHEIGHITGEPHPDDMQEEMRAEQFGRVAKMAYGLLPARAQLAAIQGGMGEVVDVVAWAWDCLGPHVTVDAIQAAELQSISVKLEPLMTVAQHQRITAAMAAEVQTWKQLHAEAQELYADAMIAIGKELGIDVSDEPRCKHVSAQAMAMAAEVERLREERDSFQRVGILATEERDALRAELAITRRVIDRIGQLCTTPHESKERLIRRVQSVIEWERATQQDQPK